MFAKYMYKHLHANRRNFMTHYTFHANVETVGAGSWLRFAKCLVLIVHPKSLLEIKLYIGDSNTY